MGLNPFYGKNSSIYGCYSNEIFEFKCLRLIMYYLLGGIRDGYKNLLSAYHVKIPHGEKISVKFK